MGLQGRDGSKEQLHSDPLAAAVCKPRSHRPGWTARGFWAFTLPMAGTVVSKYAGCKDVSKVQYSTADSVMRLYYSTTYHLPLQMSRLEL